MTSIILNIGNPKIFIYREVEDGTHNNIEHDNKIRKEYILKLRMFMTRCMDLMK